MFFFILFGFFMLSDVNVFFFEIGFGGGEVVCMLLFFGFFF